MDGQKSFILKSKDEAGNISDAEIQNPKCSQIQKFLNTVIMSHPHLKFHRWPHGMHCHPDGGAVKIPSKITSRPCMLSLGNRRVSCLDFVVPKISRYVYENIPKSKKNPKLKPLWFQAFGVEDAQYPPDSVENSLSRSDPQLWCLWEHNYHISRHLRIVRESGTNSKHWREYLVCEVGLSY